MGQVLFDEIDRLFELSAEKLGEDARAVFEELLGGLESGQLRAASPSQADDGGLYWEVQPSVRRGVLLGFRLGEHERKTQIVPGGGSARRGAYLGHNVAVMPPAFVNLGAYIGDGTTIDSHALVGSCAQIGRRVHLSAGTQIGGVLEPIGLAPVIIEDDVWIGGNSGLYAGVRVREGAVVSAGCVISAETPIFDLVHEKVYRGSADAPLVIPPRAVVVPGSRPARGDFADRNGLQVSALMIVEYRDVKTEKDSVLDEAAR